MGISGGPIQELGCGTGSGKSRVFTAIPSSNSVPIEGLSLGEAVPSSGSQGNRPCTWEEVGACL